MTMTRVEFIKARAKCRRVRRNYVRIGHVMSGGWGKKTRLKMMDTILSSDFLKPLVECEELAKNA